LAASARMEGILRTFDDKASMAVKNHITELLKGMEISQAISWEFQELVYYPPVVNHEGLTEKLQAIIPQSMQQTVKPMMIAEDFSYYQQQIPGVFLYLGSRNEERGYTWPLHSDRFQFDEDIMLTGIQLYKEILLHI
jgi:metal-dependent amidase/aminoacylase/carboxypeptidase family protein